MVAEPDGSTQPAPVCATCGTVAGDPALAAITWTRGTENGREGDRKSVV